MARDIGLTVNGTATVVAVDDERTPLLYVLRNDLLLKGTRFGCGQGQCGSCTVTVDGMAVQSCDTPIWAVDGKVVRTVEGLATAAGPSALQQAFVDEQAGQCGYCLSGLLMAAQALLERTPDPSRAQICAAIDRNLCRCGAHVRIIRAIESAARRMAPDASTSDRDEAA